VPVLTALAVLALLEVLLVLLGGAAAASSCLLDATVCAPPPVCAALLTQSSWKGFCSGLLLHLKQRSRLSNLQKHSTAHHKRKCTRMSVSTGYAAVGQYSKNTIVVGQGQVGQEGHCMQQRSHHSPLWSHS
jgi:hypothetical protein